MSAVINGISWSSNSIVQDSASGLFLGFRGVNTDTIDIQIPYISFTATSSYTFRPEVVTFVSFTGTQVLNSVILNWSTGDETSANYFDVQRSTDEINYIDVGQVKAVGNSTSLNDYSFTDQFPELGMEYYRIEEVDSNSAAQYSIVISSRITPALAYYNHNKGYNGTIQITSTDTASHSIIGTFSFDCTDTALGLHTVQIRDGQFNIQY
jgi:hypothetical protein